MAARTDAQTKQGGKQNDPISSPVVEDEPLINNMAALFAMMAPSRTKTNTEEEPEEDNKKLLLLFSQRSPAAGKAESKPDEMCRNPIQYPLVEIAPRDLGGKPALKDDPIFAKYFKTLKMGLPLQVVKKHALTREHFDSEIRMEIIINQLDQCHSPTAFLQKTIHVIQNTLR